MTKLLEGRSQCRQRCRELASRWKASVPRRKWDRLNRNHLADVLAGAWGIDSHCAKKMLSFPATAETAYQQARHVRRVAGFVSAATVGALPRLRKLLTTRSRYSLTGLTYYPGLDADVLVRAGQSPGSWDRWAGRVMRRAEKILSAWDTHPSYAALQVVAAGALGQDGKPIMPRAHRAAIKVAAQTLCLRFGMPGRWNEEQTAWIPGLDPWLRMRDARAVLVAFRLFRQSSQSSLLPCIRYKTTAYQLRELLDRDFGQQGDDDRIMPVDPEVVCWSKHGAVVADRLQPREERWRGSIRDAGRIVQVVVRDPANGHRHHLTVPPHFALPLRPGESAARRVHAAVAWTFGLTPDEYQPAKEA